MAQRAGSSATAEHEAHVSWRKAGSGGSGDKGAASYYALQQLLGQGAFAQVWQATHLKSRRRLAVKVYKRNKVADAELSNLIDGEVRVMQRATGHPNVIRLLDHHDSQRGRHIVMEFAPGGSLFARVRKSKGLPAAEAAAQFKQVVSAVAHLHASGCVHRDLKLENVLVGDDGQLKLADFGLSSVVGGTPGGTGSDRPRKVNNEVGSLLYMAPEVLGGKRYRGMPADIWSLGVVLYTMLTGAFPFHGRFEADVRRAIALDEPKWSGRGIDKGAKKLIRSMLAKAPADRPTARQVLRDPWLRSHTGGGSGSDSDSDATGLAPGSATSADSEEEPFDTTAYGSKRQRARAAARAINVGIGLNKARDDGPPQRRAARLSDASLPRMGKARRGGAKEDNVAPDVDTGSDDQGSSASGSATGAPTHARRQQAPPATRRRADGARGSTEKQSKAPAARHSRASSRASDAYSAAWDSESDSEAASDADDDEPPATRVSRASVSSRRPRSAAAASHRSSRPPSAAAAASRAERRDSMRLALRNGARPRSSTGLRISRPSTPADSSSTDSRAAVTPITYAKQGGASPRAPGGAESSGSRSPRPRSAGTYMQRVRAAQQEEWDKSMRVKRAAAAAATANMRQGKRASKAPSIAPVAPSRSGRSVRASGALSPRARRSRPTTSPTRRSIPSTTGGARLKPSPASRAPRAPAVSATSAGGGGDAGRVDSDSSVASTASRTRLRVLASSTAVDDELDGNAAGGASPTLSVATNITGRSGGVGPGSRNSPVAWAAPDEEEGPTSPAAVMRRLQPDESRHSRSPPRRTAGPKWLAPSPPSPIQSPQVNGARGGADKDKGDSEDPMTPLQTLQIASGKRVGSADSSAASSITDETALAGARDAQFSTWLDAQVERFTAGFSEATDGVPAAPGTRGAPGAFNPDEDLRLGRAPRVRASRQRARDARRAAGTQAGRQAPPRSSTGFRAAGGAHSSVDDGEGMSRRTHSMPARGAQDGAKRSAKKKRKHGAHRKRALRRPWIGVTGAADPDDPSAAAYKAAAAAKETPAEAQSRSVARPPSLSQFERVSANDVMGPRGRLPASLEAVRRARARRTMGDGNPLISPRSTANGREVDFVF